MADSGEGTMALTDLQLLTACANFMLANAAEAEDEVHERLETGASTSDVNALRMFRLHKALVAVGMFSLFEALLQDQLRWKEPFKELKAYLEARGRRELASAITDYNLAINVLKHGQGRSYEKLRARVALVDFGVGNPDEPYCEGDVSEVPVLIDVDERFVRRCAELIEQAADVIRKHEKEEWRAHEFTT
jgi:hypothetical protein